ncbi:hypothetical protein OHB06_29435 [Streptomyces sp. NBC_01604]|uniref:hypothetical protein n=1 Tax=Streptomyces sp. NBC_01604 TaxID=2975894 RepID=UPI003864ADC0
MNARTVTESVVAVMAVAALITSIFSCTSQASLTREQNSLQKEQNQLQENQNEWESAQAREATTPRVKWYVSGDGYFHIENKDSQDIRDFSFEIRKGEEATERGYVNYIGSCKKNSYKISIDLHSKFMGSDEWVGTFKDDDGKYWVINTKEKIKPAQQSLEGTASFSWGTATSADLNDCES